MTKNILASLSLIMLAALSASAQTPAEWVKFSPPGAHFSVLLPTEPQEKKEAKQSPNGPYTGYMFASVGPTGEVYLVAWVDYEKKFDMNVQAELEVNRDSFLKGLDAKLLSTTPIKLSAHPGIEFKAEVPGKADVVSRFYVVGRRPYALSVLTPVGRDSSANRQRFFSSFQLGAGE
ncbi:MAG TPA: hypothetical protein VFZ44_19945 [Pyrinomonadaceae bacterium]